MREGSRGKLFCDLEWQNFALFPNISLNVLPRVYSTITAEALHFTPWPFFSVETKKKIALLTCICWATWIHTRRCHFDSSLSHPLISVHISTNWGAGVINENSWDLQTLPFQLCKVKDWSQCFFLYIIFETYGIWLQPLASLLLTIFGRFYFVFIGGFILLFQVLW